MMIKEKLKARVVIWDLAHKDGVPPSVVRASMQEALDDAWRRSREIPEVRAAWNRYFPSGGKPSLEEFIINLSKMI